ncbi:unnamed protein product [Bathycoccus prasinos]
MTTGKELVFIFLWTLTRCVAIQLNLWDQSSENWKDFDCASQRGTCLAVEVNSGNYRVMSAYIGKGTRLTIHTNSIEHRSESNITNYEQACPTKWLATSGGWCQPPEEYKLFPHWKHFLQNLRVDYSTYLSLILTVLNGHDFFFAVRNLNKFTETINLFVEGKVSEAVESNGSRSVDIIARCN